MRDRAAPADRARAAMREASGRSAVAPFMAMDVLREANAMEAAGARVLHLEVGQPAAPAPAGARAAAAQTLEHGAIGYTESLGIGPLRARIARHYAEVDGVAVPAERAVVTTGSSAGFVLAFLAAFEAGDRVALATPGYPAYANILMGLGLETVWLETDETTRWAPTPAMLDAAGPLDGLLVASPNNPSGTVIGADALGALIEACRARGIRFVSDEIYHGLTYAGPAPTALAFGDDAVVINSFSKYYCMTGWRVGWMVVPEHLVRAVERLAQNLYISPPTLSQHAALAAFDCIDELERHKAVYAANRDIVGKALPRMGLERILPMDGAFYAYVDVSRFTDDSGAFASRLLREAGVATTPGRDFDPARGHRYLRLSLAGASSDIVEAMERMGEWLRT